MRPSRKGQQGAAILVALIAALIVLYILFLPPEDRAALIGDPSGRAPDGTPTNPANIIYTSPVGRVTVPSNPSIVHELPTVPVRAIEEGSILVRRDTVIVLNNVFEKGPSTIVFNAQPSLTRNAYLSMNLASMTGGRIIVTLNGIEVYNQAPRSRTIPPIALSNLATTNTLEITTSSVGFSFWKTNRATLSDVKITADVTDLSGASITQRFTLSSEEYATLQTSLLSFVPICTEVGSIKITVNNAEVFKGNPDCETLNTLEIAPTRLVDGENIIGYSTTSADVLLDRGRITTTARQEANKQFSFTIDPARVAGRPILLRVLFADTTDKSGYVTINGNRMPIAGGASSGMPITTALQPGQNSISFEASGKPFEVVRFEILVG